MVNAIRYPDTGLPDVLMRHARVATDGELAVEVAAGLLVGIVLGVWRPVVWVPLTCGSLCVAAFGAWGIVDRELRERSTRLARAVTLLLRAARVIIAAMGTISALILLFALLSGALGTWIS